MSRFTLSRLILAVSLSTLAGAGVAQPIEPAGVAHASATEIETRLPESHPATYLAYAQRVWYEARKDEAIFWLYVGQVRYRFLIATAPASATGAALAKFKSLSDPIAEPIECYAGHDLDRWRELIRRALAWDRDHANGFTSQADHPAEWADARGVLTRLSEYLVHHAREYRTQREQDGIGEIGMRSPTGPYIEIRRPLMPRDWPDLVPRTTLPMLTGYYAAGESGFAELFFADDPASVATANSFEIGPDTDERYLLISARRDKEVLRQIRVKAIEADDAIVLTREQEGAAAGLARGRRVSRYLVRRNLVGDLVTQCDTTTDGVLPGRSFQVHLQMTHWHSAERLFPSDEPRP